MKELDDPQLKELFRHYELEQPSENFTDDLMQKVYAQKQLEGSFAPLIPRKILFTAYGIYLFLFAALLLSSVTLPESWWQESPESPSFLSIFTRTPPQWFYYLLTCGAVLMVVDTLLYFMKKKKAGFPGV